VEAELARAPRRRDKFEEAVVLEHTEEGCGQMVFVDHCGAHVGTQW
jgi:hypothetical protein